MIWLTEAFTRLMLLSLQPLPAVAFTLLPAAIGLCAAASLKARSDDRVRAWVQLLTAILLTIWMALPWQPSDPTSLIASRSVTVFAFGYLIQDWFREAFRSGLDPRWAHRVVMLCLVLCVAAMAVSKLP
jgi:hypothetical protein